jgi:hypothetical protein
MAKYSYDDLSYEYLHKVLSYDSETGDFYWKPRPRDMFKTLQSCNAFNARFANKKAGHPHNDNPHGSGYITWTIHLLKRHRIAARLAWFMYYGEWPEDQIDHINGNSIDNRIENLRDVTDVENSRNLSISSYNKTGVMGVNLTSRGKFRARIKVYGKETALGCYSTLEEAAAARKEAEKKYGFHENHGRETVNAESE